MNGFWPPFDPFFGPFWSKNKSKWPNIEPSRDQKQGKNKSFSSQMPRQMPRGNAQGNCPLSFSLFRSIVSFCFSSVTPIKPVDRYGMQKHLNDRRGGYKKPEFQSVVSSSSASSSSSSLFLPPESESPSLSLWEKKATFVLCFQCWTGLFQVAGRPMLCTLSNCSFHAVPCSGVSRVPRFFHLSA